ncbi:molybdenum cofactor guanylyltransferase MobA [Mangrovibrevibacter kandeliae]|uniref:molybdenum cofactor guanylyltransferase MobA n=1 Tax=Mangrovibrevibacter kandeliae TaxID=2968473 RepID=UPI0021193CF1|nr:molybdenum cofactor guanylyltransferase MobA [Aurantimonas sp. CSK15Z-1]MCQ8781270.1 molybdenum cofactor guanylyltransferase [Aurantimonas sp. CSK15Z-1]
MSVSRLPPIAAVILAGGRGSRMGGPLPKPLVPLAGQPLIARVLARLGPSLRPVLISANEPQLYAGFGHPVLADTVEGFAGPLAGLDAAAAWLAARAPGVEAVLTLPADTPFLPADLVPELCAGPPGRVCVASFEGHLQPTIAVWPLAKLRGLRALLRQAGNRSIRTLLERTGFETVTFPPDPAAPGGDPFFNVNTPEELEVAAACLSK